MSENCLGFDDIILEPKYSTLKSRSEANTNIEVWKHTLVAPIISSNMKTVTNSKMAIAMWDVGGIGALHRFNSIEENVEEYRRVYNSIYKVNKHNSLRDCFVSIGVNLEDRERAEALYDAGARMFIIDIAHGHSIMMEETIKWLRDKWGEDIYIVGGNVATARGTADLCAWGADVIKCGIGNGSLCTTRVVTGHGVPIVTSLLECSSGITDNQLLICDGGIRTSGDIAKAIVCGADLVMVGSLLAACSESASPENGGKKIYQGSAFKPSKNTIAPEGARMEIDVIGSVNDVIPNLIAGLRSGMSYSNSRTLSELGTKGSFRIQTAFAHQEGLPHLLYRK